MPVLKQEQDDRSTLFDEAFLKKLEILHIISRKVFTGRLRAERRTRKVGSGIEFADHRKYTWGDDFRYIDWNVYGRVDKLLLRLFEEEEDLYIYLLLDTSKSMLIGEPLKLHYAMQVAAALSYVGLANLDRVAIIPFSAAKVKLRCSQRVYETGMLCPAWVMLGRSLSTAPVSLQPCHCFLNASPVFSVCGKIPGGTMEMQILSLSFVSVGGSA